MIKTIKKAIIPVMAAGVLALGGCAAVTSQTQVPSQTSVQMQTDIQTSAETPAETSAETTTAAAIAETLAQTLETEGSEWFSNRDLAGTYDESEAVEIKLDGESVSITEEGVYIISGNISDGQIIVDVDNTEKVQLVLDGVTISSSDSAAIYVKSADKVFITLAQGSTNILSTTGEFVAGDDNVDAVIFAKDDLTINGSGSLEVSTEYGHGIVAKDDLTITGGTITVESSSSAISVNDVLAICGADITVTSDKDAIECENDDPSLGIIYIESGTFNIESKGDAISATGNLLIVDGEFDILAAGGSSDSSMKGLKSDTDITIDSGVFTLQCSEDAIHADGCVTINGGTFDIDTNDDGIHADGMLTINGGDFDINCWEGLEATYILINDGDITIYANDDGINAANKSSDYEIAVDIRGGYITIEMASGDTDGVDSNGNLYINGGTIDVTGQSAFDYDGYAEYNGGTIIVNGQETNSIPNQMMGGGGMGGPGGWRR